MELLFGCFREWKTKALTTQSYIMWIEFLQQLETHHILDHSKELCLSFFSSHVLQHTVCLLSLTDKRTPHGLSCIWNLVISWILWTLFSTAFDNDDWAFCMLHTKLTHRSNKYPVHIATSVSWLHNSLRFSNSNNILNASTGPYSSISVKHKLVKAWLSH